MKPQRALVTGATGFVGSHLVKNLLAEGWSVHIICRTDSTLDQLSSVIGRVVVHRFDGNIDSMREIMRQSSPDVVFHLASLFLSEHQPQDVQRLIESNLLFGAQLAEAMSLEGVRCLVNTGTSWQHYESKDYSPVNLYAATKQAFEDLLQYYVEARNLSVITLKLFDTYGPDDPRPKLINLLRRLSASTEALAMSPGEQLIDLVHVEDVARAFGLAGVRLVSGEVAGHERYSIASGQHLSLKELVFMIEKLLNRRLQIHWGAKPYRGREVMTPWSAPTLPGWHPAISLHKGLSQLMLHSKQ